MTFLAISHWTVFEPDCQTLNKRGLSVRVACRSELEVSVHISGGTKYL